MTNSAGYGNLILMEKGERIARITFNRPEKRNAMSEAMQAELRAALDDCKDCTVVTLWGGDGPSFCSGIDLAEGRARAASGERRRTYSVTREDWSATCHAIADHPAVCIASVNGYALGGGTSMINCCDLAVASEKAELGMPEMGFGTFPGIAAPFMSKMVLPKHARQLVFMAQRVDAETALRMGLVNWVVPHDKLREETDKVAERVAQLDPVIVDWAKRGLRMLDHVPWEVATYIGTYINATARQRGSGGSESLDRFLAGQPGLGQGASGN